MNPFSEFSHHGGALDAARRTFPDAPLPWLDLSTGINAVPYPIGAIAADAWSRLPDAASLHALEQAAAARYDVPIGAAVVAAPGTQAIIQHLPTLCGGRDVRLLGATYGEFKHVFEAAGARVRTVPHAEALAGADVAVVVNPNNPDGRLVAPGDLTVLARRVGHLVVDEAYVDALDAGHSLASRLPTSRVIVLRSFGKIYGLAGLRLGFALTFGSSGEMLRERLGPWPINGPAIAIGTRALRDDAWLAQTRERLEADGARLAFLLGNAGAQAIGKTPLFRLVAHPAARALFTALAKRGILVRPFSSQPSWLRFGLPGDATGWARLEAAMLGFH